MKKLMTILVVFALCGVAMAAESKNYNLKNGQHDYSFVTGNKNLTYTATGSNIYSWESSSTKGNAHVYFTTLSADALAATGNTTVAVQFLGVDLDTDQKKNLDDPKNFKYDSNYSGHDVYHITDYGIYLYDPKTGAKGEYMSVKDYNNYFEIGADKSFGVYYEDVDGRICTTTDNYAGNYDTNSHKITVYDEDGKPQTKTTDTRFMCLMGKQWAGYETDHWEFMLQTTLDNPYYPVNPNDFGGDVNVDNPVVHGDEGGPSGQPLPGTLATLLIGSLCASALRKKNQK